MKKDFIRTILSELDRAARKFEADAINEEDDGEIRAATYHEGVARGLELASFKIRRLTGELRRFARPTSVASRRPSRG